MYFISPARPITCRSFHSSKIGLLPAGLYLWFPISEEVATQSIASHTLQDLGRGCWESALREKEGKEGVECAKD